MLHNDPRLSDLLVEWELRRQEGTPVTPEELCGGSPELLNPLRQLIREQEAADNLLGVSGDANTCTGADETLSRVSVLMRYADLRLTARGGQSEILLADDEELRRPIAVKVIKSEHMPFAKTRADFLREAEVTSRLEHPGIVPVHGVGRMPDGRPCYSMRFVKGQTLREAIKDFHDAEKPGRDPAERSLALRALLNRFIAVCNTIGYAHSRGILHRDIKPENIMLGKFGETLVLDWGLAKEVKKPESEAGESHGWQSVGGDADGNDTAQGQAIGTPSYMSPEQAAGRWDQVGPASDVFSLGATLYAILTGRAPYHGKSVNHVIEKAKACEFEPPRAVKHDVPRALEAICLKGMAVEPKSRFADVTGLAGDVEHWLADEAIGAWREPIRVRCYRWIRRHRTLVAGSVAAIVVAAITLAWAIFRLNGVNNDLRLANENEKFAKEDAQENYKVARSAVARYLGRVRRDDRLGTANLLALRKELLLEAVPFFKQFLDKYGRSDDIALQTERADAFMTLGAVFADTGARREAVKYVEQGLQTYQGLAMADPAHAEYQTQVYEGHYLLGMIHSNLHQPERAERELVAALGVSKRLTARSAVKAAAQSLLLTACDELARVYQDSGQLDKADAILAEMASELRTLKPGTTTNSQLPDDLAELRDRHELAQHFLRGRKAFGQNQLESALDAYQRAEQLCKKLRNAKSKVYRSGAEDTMSSILHQMGHVYFAMGDAKRAEQAYRYCMAHSKKRLESDPEATASKYNLASAASELGRVYLLQRDWDRAKLEYPRIQQLWESIAVDCPGDPEGKLEWARSFGNEGYLYWKTDHFDRAKLLFKKAIQMTEAVLREYPTLVRSKTDLAVGHNNLTCIYLCTKELDEAETCARRAMELYEDLGSSPPTQGGSARGLAGAVGNLGLVLKERKNFDAAVTCFTREIQLLEQCLIAEPSDHVAKQFLANGYQYRAEALTGLNRFDASLADWKRSMSLRSLGVYVDLRTSYALTLARAGLFSQARVEVSIVETQLLVASGVPASVYVDLCRIWSILAYAENTEPSQRDRYASRAIVFLRKAQKAGYFNPTSRCDDLKDKDFSFLHDRQDFKAFLAEVDVTVELVPVPPRPIQ